jgi:hypothetical protein
VDRKARLLMKLINLYPPYVAAGVSVRWPKDDPYVIESRLRLRFWNRNLFGTHFGGSLYAMCDPFFVFLLVHHLGPEYVVWDKAAAIQFKRPGRGLVRAFFRVTPEEVAAIRARADAGEKVEPVYTAEIRDEAGDVVASVEKRLWVKRKERRTA